MLYIAATGRESPSRRLNVAKFAPQIRVAFCNMVWNTGSEFALAKKDKSSPQHIRRCRLLLQRLGKVGRALAQFVQQPRVFDGDYGLGGKILHQFDLLVGERPHFLSVDAEGTP